ncbi:hypothetical protein GCM10023340_32160 [Nocardioides marinquilinus]|uniref:Uncharacterized protein n=1 Tax=Nocardioides marinquilinus TaxID=1210400 RepID=A0ABP9PU85_9ACTN
MENLGLALDAAWQVLLVGLVLGAGLPAVFALGIRFLGQEHATSGGTGFATAGPTPVGRVLAGVCFLVVLAGIALGITIVVAAGFDKEVSFEHVFPTIVDAS